MLIGIASNAFAQSTEPETGAAFPRPMPSAAAKPVFESPEAADAALVRVARERSETQASYERMRRECYRKFLVTACLDSARERERLAMARLTSIEVEAKAFLRRDKAARSDKALEEKRLAFERDARERESEVKDREEALARKRTASEERVREAAVAPAPDRAQDARVLRHEERVREREAAAAKEEATRAQNVIDYQNKVRNVEENKRKVAERLAQKERERKAREAAAAAKKAETPADAATSPR